ncbi:MAG: asparagine synthase-related protein [Pseudomonadota bacterium]
MYRFVAFSWNVKDPTKRAAARRLGALLLSTAPDWQCVLDTPGLRVFQARHPGGAYHSYVLKRNGGVILGRLFDRDFDEDQSSSDPTFDDKESNRITESAGRHLVERYWGHYVAFLRNSGGDRRFTLRDPTGGLPCFLTQAAGIDMIISDVEDCVRLNLTPFSVDWDHLTAFFVHMRLITRTTGLKEVTQLYAGECLAMEDDALVTRMNRSFYWNPVDVCESGAVEDPAEARAMLREVVSNCVNAWASSYDSIVHELSGGLDSSVVAACLAKAAVRPDVLCFHYFTEMSEGDERSYARAAALSAEFELVERVSRVSERTLEEQLDTSRLATPAVLGFLPETELLRQRLVNDRDAGAIFSGQGGDHLFEQGGSRLIAAEYVHRHGVRPQLLGIVANTSRLTRMSIWSVFGAVIRYGLLRRSYDPYAFYYEAPSILSDHARASLSPDSYTHPWVESAGRLPASKIQQIFHVVDCQPFYLVSCPYAEQIHPLISQPIIECALQIPTYVLTHRGKDRGLFREAFEADVPSRIINRHSKGATSSYFNRILVENAPFLRELLLDGALVQQGILSRVALEKELSERELVRGAELQPILRAARAETWLRNWADVRQRTAA